MRVIFEVLAIFSAVVLFLAGLAYLLQFDTFAVGLAVIIFLAPVGAIVYAIFTPEPVRRSRRDRP